MPELRFDFDGTMDTILWGIVISNRAFIHVSSIPGASL